MKTKFLSALLSCVAITMPVAAYAQDRENNSSIKPAIDTIIVTAKRNPAEPAIVGNVRTMLSRTPGAVSIVANEVFEDRSSQGLSDLLRDVPGVLAQKRYGEESRFSIRGSGIDQSYHQRGVLFAQDGVPFADADGFSDFQKIDPLTARYVEVYRGGNALRFGGAQLGGAINLVTPTGRTAQSENMLRTEGGSFGLMRGAGQIARVIGAWDIFAAGTILSSKGFREHSEQEQYRGTLNTGYRFGEDREVRLITYVADIKQEVPGTLTLADALSDSEKAGAGVEFFNWKRDQAIWRISLQSKWRFSDSLLFEGSVYATGADLDHPISLLIDQQIQTQGVFGRFDWSGELAGHKSDLFWGAYYRQGHVDQILDTVTFPVTGDSRRKAKGLDLFVEGRFFVTDSLALVAGGSYGLATRDYTDHLNSTNNTEKDFNWFSPRVGLLWENEDGIQLYANVTRSMEPPHYGALVQAPNPGFVPVNPQEAWTGEIGTRGRLGQFLWDLTLYRAELENELLSFNVTTGIPASVFNAGKTVHQGIEAALDWKITDDLFDGSLLLRQTYAYSDFSFNNDPTYKDNRIPIIPEHQYRASLRYSHNSGWFAEPSVEWRPKDVFVDYANTFKAPGYAVFSFNAGWDFDSGMSLFLDARNLTNTNYVPEFGAITDASLASTNKAVFYPGEGAAVTGGIIFRF